jgi:hypothetical protein
VNGPDHNSLPEYLKRWPGLWVREGSDIVPAMEEDVEVARAYPNWPYKGPLTGGQRLTILTARRRYGVAETVRVIHVFEIAEAGRTAYVMGPKPIHGEYVDQQLTTPPAKDDGTALRPRNYDGVVLSSPVVDYAFDITTYTFAKHGLHRIVWIIDDLASNELVIEVDHEMS